MHRRLLVAHQDVPDAVLLIDRVIDRQHGSAGIAEDDLDPLIAERPQQNFGAGLLQSSGHAHLSLLCGHRIVG